MKRYSMLASNGAVVPHESSTGSWVKHEDFQLLKDFTSKDYIRLPRVERLYL